MLAMTIKQMTEADSCTKPIVMKKLAEIEGQ